MKIGITKLARAAAVLSGVLLVAACQPAQQRAAVMSPAESAAQSAVASANAGLLGTPSVPAPRGDGTAPATSTPPPTPSTPSVPAVSQQSLDYARSIGGISQDGRTLYFVIGTSVDSEAAARAALKRAIPLFGDTQSYYVVQRSDNFDGLRRGWWIVAEAYSKPPSKENLAFGRRAFKDAYVRRAVVRTTDPIPVYEDLVPGSN